MAGAQRFEDLVAWQKARALTKAVFEVTSSGPLSRNYRLAGQLESASVSVMSNIAEGYQREGAAGFHRFLTIAKASCGEVRSLLYVLLDADLIDDRTFERLTAQASETSRVLVGLRASVERRLRPSQQRAINEDALPPYLLDPDDPKPEH